MAGFSTYSANKILDCFFNNTTFTGITTPYISLHTSDPGSTGSGEVSGGSYARTAGSFSAAASKAVENDGIITFPTASGSWGLISYWGAWDASSSGNFLCGGQLTVSKTVTSGDSFRFDSGMLDIALN